MYQWQSLKILIVACLGCFLTATQLQAQGTSDFVHFRPEVHNDGEDYLKNVFQVRVHDSCISEYDKEKFDLSIDLRLAYKGLKKDSFSLPGYDFNIVSSRIVIKNLVSGKKYNFPITNNVTGKTTVVSGYARLYCRLGKKKVINYKPHRQVSDMMYYLMAVAGKSNRKIFPASSQLYSKKLTPIPETSAFYKSSSQVSKLGTAQRPKNEENIPEEVVTLVRTSIIGKTEVDVPDDSLFDYSINNTTDGSQSYSFIAYFSDNLGFISGTVVFSDTYSSVYTYVSHPNGSVNIRAFHDYENQISEITDTFSDGSSVINVYDFSRVITLGSLDIVEQNPNGVGYGELYTITSYEIYNYDLEDPDTLYELLVSSTYNPVSEQSENNGGRLGLHTPGSRLEDLPSFGILPSSPTSPLNYFSTILSAEPSESVSLGGGNSSTPTFFGRFTNFMSTYFSPNNDGPVQHSTDNSPPAAPRPTKLRYEFLPSSPTSLKIIFSRTHPTTDDENYIRWGSNSHPINLFKNGEFHQRYRAPGGDVQHDYMWILDGFVFGHNGWQGGYKLFSSGYAIIEDLTPGATYTFSAFRGWGNGPSAGQQGRTTSIMSNEISVTMPGVLTPDQPVAQYVLRPGDSFRFSNLNVKYDGQSVCLIHELGTPGGNNINDVENDYSNVPEGSFRDRLTSLYSQMWGRGRNNWACGRLPASPTTAPTAPLPSTPTLQLQPGDIFRYDDLNVKYDGNEVCLYHVTGRGLFTDYTSRAKDSLTNYIDQLFSVMWNQKTPEQRKCKR